MGFRLRIVNVMLVSVIACVTASASELDDTAPVSASGNQSWNQASAAKYLDGRETWWQAWPRSQRDHGTICVSCHSVLPYALARPVLRHNMGEADFAGPEHIMVNNVVRRVTLWKDVEPFYKDNKSGPTKSIESRSTEAVLNALILASYDARTDHLREITKEAFANAWAMQRHSGDNSGAWIWLNFHYAPWESNESEYHGAALAALAAGIAPDHYSQEPAVQANLRELRGYLRRQYTSQPLVNQIVLLWASAKLPGLLTLQQRSLLVRSIFAKQQTDGGWSLTDLGTWKRRDDTALETKSDGYATGLTVLALEKNGMGRLPQVNRGLTWLKQNQDPSNGRWPAWSLNKKRDPASDAGPFMSDAATGYAVLALESGR